MAKYEVNLMLDHTVEVEANDGEWAEDKAFEMIMQMLNDGTVSFRAEVFESDEESE